MTVTSAELAGQLNRNALLTTCDTVCVGGRGAYELIREIWMRLGRELGLEEEASSVAETSVEPGGYHARCVNTPNKERTPTRCLGASRRLRARFSSVFGGAWRVPVASRNAPDGSIRGPGAPLLSVGARVSVAVVSLAYVHAVRSAPHEPVEE